MNWSSILGILSLETDTHEEIMCLQLKITIYPSIYPSIYLSLGWSLGNLKKEEEKKSRNYYKYNWKLHFRDIKMLCVNVNLLN